MILKKQCRRSHSTPGASPAYWGAGLQPLIRLVSLRQLGLLFLFFHPELFALQNGGIVLGSPVFSETLVHFH